MAAPFALDTKVTIERKTTQRDPDYGTVIEAWVIVADHIWANVQDVLPSRSAEFTSNGLRTAKQTSRLRIRKQHQVTAEMRVTLHGRFGDRVMQIIAGPALMDDRAHTEYMLEGYTS
jgi:SPP1 family predicted phage head-tail adaptor